MADNAGNAWEWLKMARKGQKQLSMTGNGKKWLYMARNDTK